MEVMKERKKVFVCRKQVNGAHKGNEVEVKETKGGNEGNMER